MGSFRHWVTNTVFCDTIDCETCANSEEGPTYVVSIHRDIRVDITHMETDGLLAYISGECWYDTKESMSKEGKLLLVEVIDGGIPPAVYEDMISWKWFPGDAVIDPEQACQYLNTKQIIEGNLSVFYNPSGAK